METKMSWQKATHELFARLENFRAIFLNSNEDISVVPVSYNVVVAFDFGRISSRQFFSALQCMIELTDTENTLVAAIHPDPVDYYLRNFGLVPAFEIATGTSDQEFLRNLHWEPVNGGANSIATHAERVGIFSREMTWVVLGERRFELAQLYVRKDIAGLKIQECLPTDWCYDKAEVESLLLINGFDASRAHSTADHIIS